MEKVIFILILAISTAVLLVFVFEGREDPQDITPIMEVGTNTARNIIESATIPIKISVQDEKKIGKRILRRFLARFPCLPDSDPKLLNVVRVGNSMAKHCRRQEIVYRFYVVDTMMVNAFALPAGYVVVTSGLLAISESDDELAYVLGHEIAHVEYKHALIQLRAEMVKKKLELKNTGLDTLVNIMDNLIRIGYSEVMELEADRGGVRMAANAGYDPAAAINLIDRIADPKSEKHQSRNPAKMLVKIPLDAMRAYFRTHPHWEKRKYKIIAEIRKLRKLQKKGR